MINDKVIDLLPDDYQDLVNTKKRTYTTRKGKTIFIDKCIYIDEVNLKDSYVYKMPTPEQVEIRKKKHLITTQQMIEDAQKSLSEL